MILRNTIAALAIGMGAASHAHDGQIEVTHWWTSGGEAAAAAELARAYNATGGEWIDGAIAGSSGTARPIIISRILGGDPMGATQLNHGRQAEELVRAGLMTDLTELAEAEDWRNTVYPPSLLDSCTHEGRIYCAPVNIHSFQWFWLSHAAYDKAGLSVPTNWHEFVESAPQLREAGVIPLAMGKQPWQQAGAFDVLAVAIAGEAARNDVINGNAETVRGPEYTALFEATAAARELARGSYVQDWNQATNLVITGRAGGQIMGDWAQGEFQVAGLKAGEDYSCLPGLGLNNVLDTGGDAFYFPKTKDKATQAAQLKLASLLISKETQVAFNLKKGSLPIRGDINLSAANECMKKGLNILADGGAMQSGEQAMTSDVVTQLEDLMAEFWATDMPAAYAQERYAKIIESAD